MRFANKHLLQLFIQSEPILYIPKGENDFYKTSINCYITLSSFIEESIHMVIRTYDEVNSRKADNFLEKARAISNHQVFAETEVSSENSNEWEDIIKDLVEKMLEIAKEFTPELEVVA